MKPQINNNATRNERIDIPPIHQLAPYHRCQYVGASKYVNYYILHYGRAVYWKDTVFTLVFDNQGHQFAIDLVRSGGEAVDQGRIA